MLATRGGGRIRLTREAAYRSESADGSCRGNAADHGNGSDTDAGSRSGSRSPRGSSRRANSGSGRTTGTGSSSDSDSDSDGYGCRTRFPGNLGAAALTDLFQACDANQLGSTGNGCRAIRGGSRDFDVVADFAIQSRPLKLDQSIGSLVDDYDLPRFGE